MSGTDIVRVGRSLPRLRAVKALPPSTVAAVWSDGTESVVDLAPVLFSYKVFKPLRHDPALFATVRVDPDGGSISWDDGTLDMAATTLRRLADESMTAADFAAFLKRNGLTLDSAAAQLGISRRLAAYYASDRAIPRHVALACAYLDRHGGSLDAREQPAAGPRSPRHP